MSALLVDGIASPSQNDYLSYRIEYEYPPLPLLVGSLYRGYNEGIMGSCVIAVDNRIPYIVTHDDHLEQIVIKQTTNGPAFFTSRSINDLPSRARPHDLLASVSGFATFWNVVARSSRSAYVDKINYQAGAAFIPNPDVASVEIPPMANSITHGSGIDQSWREEVKERFGTFEPIMPSIASTNDKFVKDYSASLPFLARLMLFSTKLFSKDRYLVLDFLEREPDRGDVVFVGPCYPDEDVSTSTTPLRVAVRARLEYMETEWKKKLWEQTRAEGSLVNDEPSFQEKYPDLSRHVVGREHFRIAALHDALEAEIPSDVDRVSVFDVTVPLDLLRDLGIVIIVLCQIYSTLHMIEVRVRLQRNNAADPGAFVPWILLYGQSYARITSLAMLAVPSMVVGRVLYVSVLPTIETRPSGDVSILSWLLLATLSLFLTITSWQVWGDFSSQAEANRNFSAN